MKSAGLTLALASLTLACPSAPPCPSPSAPLAPAEPAKSAATLLGGVADRATRSGAGPLLVVGDGIASEGDRVGGFVSLPKDKCVLVYARASKGVGDLDLFAYADDGSELATDESASPEAGFVLCPPVPDRVFLAARVASGAGTVALGAQEVAVAEATAAASAVGARGRGEESGRLESWPGLEAKIVGHRRAVGSSWEDVRRFVMLVDPRAATRTSVPVDAGRCLDVLVVPTEEVANLDVVAEAEDGRIVARAQQDGRDRSLVLCSEAGDNITIAARPRGNSGMAAFVLGRSPKGAAAEIGQSVRVERLSHSDTADKARVLFAKDADPLWGKASAAGAGEAKGGSRTSLDVKLSAGCSRLDVLAGAPLGPLSAALWDDGGSLLSEGLGSSRATLYACGKERSLRLDVESRGRPGPFLVDARTWKDAPPELMKRPVAAARLLERVAGGELQAGQLIADARPLDLEAEKLITSSFVAAAETCTEVVVAIEGGSGLDLRLVDDATQDDALARGRFVASQRLCATKSPRKARLELRVERGPAKALVAFLKLGS